jgi:hypothetical protein
MRGFDFQSRHFPNSQSPGLSRRFFVRSAEKYADNASRPLPLKETEVRVREFSSRRMIENPILENAPFYHGERALSRTIFLKRSQPSSWRMCSNVI